MARWPIFYSLGIVRALTQRPVFSVFFIFGIDCLLPHFAVSWLVRTLTCKQHIFSVCVFVCFLLLLFVFVFFSSGICGGPISLSSLFGIDCLLPHFVMPWLVRTLTCKQHIFSVCVFVCFLLLLFVVVFLVRAFVAAQFLCLLYLGLTAFCRIL